MYTYRIIHNGYQLGVATGKKRSVNYINKYLDMFKNKGERFWNHKHNVITCTVIDGDIKNVFKAEIDY